jgi:uncharacterized protein (TIGR03032 family)
MTDALEARFDAHGREWRDPMQVTAQWSDVGIAGPDDLAAKATGAWWDVLRAAKTTLIVSREYEHLLLAIAADARPRISYFRLPHPSGITYDAARSTLYVASTRNPNQIYAFAPVTGSMRRGDVEPTAPMNGTLVPTHTRYLPGCYYIHDLAMVGGRLHANSVGQNVVVEVDDTGARPVWWPACIERNGVPRTDRNYIQLNSIAAGADIRSSFFSASGDAPGRYRPGHAQYPVDRRGVIYSGATREPIARGLTRPHSARLHGDELWVDNSGYGELGRCADGRFEPVAVLSGWTRGLAFVGDVAFVGTSRVIPRFRQYAPGLDVDRSQCGVHAVDTRSGKVLGSLWFPAGNQIFAIEPVPADVVTGFPFHRRSSAAHLRSFFYAYRTESPRDDG